MLEPREVVLKNLNKDKGSKQSKSKELEVSFMKWNVWNIHNKFQNGSGLNWTESSNVCCIGNCLIVILLTVFKTFYAKANVMLYFNSKIF